ncbi:MAG: hypothetical protein KGI80_03575 [Verrucomicrobiota bacterium]|nr:hypothetical protein [Verrucomicrobiota bacterium]
MMTAAVQNSSTVLPAYYEWKHQGADQEWMVTKIVKWAISFFQSLWSGIFVPATWLSPRTFPTIPKGWEAHSLELNVDGVKIHATMVGKTENLNNKKWLLYSGGNGEHYEMSRLSVKKDKFFKEFNAGEYNALFFHYPGVSHSKGRATKETMTNAYKAALSFLEDKGKGIGAEEIIGYGFSIGGGVQGEALRTHELKEGVHYCFIKDRTFSDLSAAADGVMGGGIFGKIAAFLTRVTGWNFSSVESSKALKAPEIIIQQKKFKVAEWSVTLDGSPFCYNCGPTIVANGTEELIDTDGVITKEASLANALLSDPSWKSFSQCKHVIAVEESHCILLKDKSTEAVWDSVKSLMEKYYRKPEEAVA